MPTNLIPKNINRTYQKYHEVSNIPTYIRSNWLCNRQPKQIINCLPVLCFDVWNEFPFTSRFLIFHKYFTSSLAGDISSLRQKFHPSLPNCVCGVSRSAASGCNSARRKICLNFLRALNKISAERYFSTFAGCWSLFAWLLQFYQDFMVVLYYRQKIWDKKLHNFMCKTMRLHHKSTSNLFLWAFLLFCIENT